MSMRLWESSHVGDGFARLSPPLQEQSERRVAAILLADVVGYSRLMQDNETGTFARLKRRQALLKSTIGRHEGRLIKSMGDALLATFTSGAQAVTCAIEMQQAMQARNARLSKSEHMVYRIGINLGDLIVDGDDLYGNEMNVVARLEKLAPHGGLCVSGNVHDQIKGKLALSFSEWGEQPIKHMAHPLRVFALGPDDIASIQIDALTESRPRAVRVEKVFAGAVAAALFAMVASGWWSAITTADAVAAMERDAPQLTVDLPYVVPVSSPLLWSNLPVAHASPARELREELSRRLKRALDARGDQPAAVADVLAALMLADAVEGRTVSFHEQRQALSLHAEISFSGEETTVAVLEE